MKKLEDYTRLIEGRLYDFLPDSGLPQGRVIKAALHSLSAGGKRIRPVLTLAFCEMCGGDMRSALDTACAIEYMHTFSLIHDDLPCMDDDDLRRGRPSCHAAFDEATALLAGDALAIMPFSMITASAIDGKISFLAAARCADLLAECAGFLGMIGGQQIDTENDGKELPEELLLSMYRMKTGALLRAACGCGVICAEPPDLEEALYRSAEYAENLGLAFQITDDILDITGTTEELGKPAGSDESSDKHTFPHIYGLEAAREAAAVYTEKALTALGYFEHGEFAAELTRMLLNRKK